MTGRFLLIISSPSGEGKTTLTARLLSEGARADLQHFAHHAQASAKWTKAKEHHVVSREEFERLIDQGAFLEWAEVHGNLHGTSRAEIERRQGDRGIVFDIDHQGARQIKCAAPESVAVFILPPSMAVLEKRLRGRASEDEETVQRRFSVAKGEIAHYGLFDYVLVNADLDEATRKLISIFLAEECRRSRVATLAEQFLAEGRGRPPH